MSNNTLSCRDQHKEYSKNRALISAQIKTLNEKHANCLSLQSSNNLKLEKIALDQKNYQKCLSDLEYWKSQEDLKRQNEECNKTLSTLLKYKEYSNALEKKNRAAILDWEKYRDAVNAHNLKKKSSYDQSYKKYQTDLKSWNSQNAARASYLSQQRKILSDIEKHWSAQRSKFSWLKDYSFTFKARKCGNLLSCIEDSYRKELQKKRCAVIRGLGSTSKTGDICLFARFAPPCPSSCPVYVPAPGKRPVPPLSPNYVAIKKPPASLPILTLEKFAEVNKLPLGNKNCELKEVDKISSTPPSCTKPSPEPLEPIICNVPELPTLPQKPTCDPSLFAGISPMWLALVAGGAGIYLYSKRTR